MTKEKAGLIVPSNPKDQENIRLVVDDITLLMSKIDLLKEDIKAQIEGLAETYELPKSFVNWMVKTKYKDNFENVSRERTEFEIAFETILGKDQDVK